MRRGPSSLSRNLLTTGLTLVLAYGISAPANAQHGQAAPQDVPSVPKGLAEPQGFIAEPAWLERTAVFADRHLSSGGGGGTGFYVNTKSPVSGAGWLTLGPGYRHWFNNEHLLVDGTTGVSWRGYKLAQARVEMPKLLRSRLALGAQYRYQDFRSLKFFGEGSDSPETALSHYHLRTHNVVGYATVRPLRWMAMDTHVGWLEPALRDAGVEPAFAHAGVALTADTRDFPEHPTRGGLVRVAASRFDDRDGGESSFERYESEVAGFVPLASSRVVLAVRGWLVTSDTDSGKTVPFYLQPSLGGGHSLRSFSDYRFHDRHMLLANAELRVALFTHIDLVGFVDAGNVAARIDDLDLDKRSYGAGLRLHTRRDTFLRIDVANGSEGWRTMFSLSEPLSLSRLSRRYAPAPFVP